MKFKLDENLPVELVTDLRGLGHDVDTVIGEGLGGAADPQLWMPPSLLIGFCSR